MSHFFQCIRIVYVDMLNVVLLLGVGCGQEVPAVRKLQLADTLDNYFSVGAKLCVEDMVEA